MDDDDHHHGGLDQRSELWKVDRWEKAERPKAGKVRGFNLLFTLQQARKPRSYASPKLRPTDPLTGVKCRATSVAKNINIKR